MIVILFLLLTISIILIFNYKYVNKEKFIVYQNNKYKKTNDLVKYQYGRILNDEKYFTDKYPYIGFIKTRTK